METRTPRRAREEPSDTRAEGGEATSGVDIAGA